LIYVFDNSSISRLKHFFPTVFEGMWSELNAFAENGSIISTREVQNELKRGAANPIIDAWIEKNKHIFIIPTQDELLFVREILAHKAFKSSIGTKQTMAGSPVADPFIVALAKIKNGTVVTEEKYKANSGKIPTICAHFKIQCLNLEEFFQAHNFKY